MKKFSLFFFLLVLTSLSFPAKKVMAADCGAPVPPAVEKITAVSGPSDGQVTLYWEVSSYANRYAVAYGLTSNKYMYGADNIGGEKSRSYTVKGLTAGTRYYFRLAAARDSCSSPFSAEVSAVAREGKEVAPTIIPTVRKEAPPLPSGPVGRQKLVAIPGPKTGEVTLSWQHADSSNNYHLVYGTEPGKFKYGALNLGKITSLTVRKLTPGVVYYFALVPLMGERPLYTTDQVKAVAKTEIGKTVTSPTPKRVFERTPSVQKPKAVASPSGLPTIPLTSSPAAEATSFPSPTIPAGY